MDPSPETISQLPAWAVIAYLLAKDVIDGLRSRRSQGERIGELRRDLDEIASDLNVKLKRRHRGGASHHE